METSILMLFSINDQSILVIVRYYKQIYS